MQFFHIKTPAFQYSVNLLIVNLDWKNEEERDILEKRKTIEQGESLNEEE
jgi:hypothetical protein